MSGTFSRFRVCFEVSLRHVCLCWRCQLHRVSYDNLGEVFLRSPRRLRPFSGSFIVLLCTTLTAQVLFHLVAAFLPHAGKKSQHTALFPSVGVAEHQRQRALGLIHTGRTTRRARKLECFSLMLLACSVNTPIDNNRSHLLAWHSLQSRAFASSWHVSSMPHKLSWCFFLEHGFHPWNKWSLNVHARQETKDFLSLVVHTRPLIWT